MDRRRRLISFRRVVSKRFPGVRALEDVSFDIARGSCHALCGENGAGKSTLGKLLAGIDVPDGGEILLDGRPVRFDEPARRAGGRRRHGPPGAGLLREPVGGREPLPGRAAAAGAVRRSRRRDGAARRASCWTRSRRPSTCDRLVGELTVAEQQVVQIAAAVGGGARVIIFDEPTSSLSAARGRPPLRAVESAARARRHLRLRLAPDAGDLPPVRHDHRAARRPTRRDAADARARRGRPGRADDRASPRPVPPRTDHARAGRGDPAGRRGCRARASFTTSASRSAPARSSAWPGWSAPGAPTSPRRSSAWTPTRDGRVEVGGQPLPGGSPVAAMRAGVGLVPEDRKRQGLVPQLTRSSRT